MVVGRMLQLVPDAIEESNSMTSSKSIPANFWYFNANSRYVGDKPNPDIWFEHNVGISGGLLGNLNSIVELFSRGWN